MDLNPPEFWRCSACTYANNPWGLVECEMCGAAVLKEAKRPPEDAALPTAASKLEKQAKGVPAVGSMGTSCPIAKNDTTVPAVRPWAWYWRLWGRRGRIVDAIVMSTPAAVRCLRRTWSLVSGGNKFSFPTS